MLATNLDALASASEFGFCPFPKKYGGSDCKSQNLIYQDNPWNPYLTQESLFWNTNFFFWIYACLNSSIFIFSICKVRAKDVNDISVGRHKHYKFDERSAFVNTVRLSLKSIFWTFVYVNIYTIEEKDCGVCIARSSGSNIAMWLRITSPRVIWSKPINCGTNWVIIASLTFITLWEIQDDLSIPNKDFSMLFERPVRRFVEFLNAINCAKWDLNMIFQNVI